jgi:hypothetical protein
VRLAELREELELPEYGVEGLHELLARVVMDTVVRGHHDARVLGQPLHLLLHDARVVRAPVVAPACTSRSSSIGGMNYIIVPSRTI